MKGWTSEGIQKIKDKKPAPIKTNALTQAALRILLPIKPLSVNEAWQGKRFKTKKYISYEKEILFSLPISTLPASPYKVYYEFGFSNVQSDLDNPVKLIQDLLQKKYGFNDKDIMEANVKKVIVKKGAEYIKLTIETI